MKLWPQKNAPRPTRQERVRQRDEERQQLQAGSQFAFRRNVTRAGGYSYETAQAHEDSSHRHRVHHLAERRRRAGSVFVGSVAAVLVLGFLLSQFTATVAIGGAGQQLSTSSSRQHEAYTQAIEQYFGIHPAERLRGLLNQTALLAYLSAQYPEVEGLAIEQGSLPTETLVRLTYREPVAGWRIQNEQYYVDNDGVVFRDNFFSEPTVNIIDQSGIEPSSGVAVASGRLLGFVGRVVALSQSRGYSAVTATLPADTTRRLDVTFKDVAPVIRFSSDGGAGEQVDDMVRSLTFLSSRGISATYVDVRVGGQIVYK